MKFQNKFTNTLFGSGFLVLGFSLTLGACGQVKDRDEKIVVVKSDDTEARSNPDQQQEITESIRRIYELYSNNEGLLQEEAIHLSNKIIQKLRDFTGNPDLSSEDVVELLFAFKETRTDRMTPKQLYQGINKNIPLAAWITHRKSTNTEEFSEELARVYPQLKKATRAEMLKAVMLFDAPTLGGDSDQKISPKEALTPIMILSVATKFNLNRVLLNAIASSQMDTVKTLLLGALDRKLFQQIFLRHDTASLQKLSEEDRRMEWALLTLKFYALQQLYDAHTLPTAQTESTESEDQPSGIDYEDLDLIYSIYSDKKEIPSQKLNSLLTKRAAQLYTLTRLQGKKRQGVYLDFIEMFDLVTDLEFYQKIEMLYDRFAQPKWADANALPEDLMKLHEGITGVLPSVGESIFFQKLSPAKNKKLLVEFTLNHEVWKEAKENGFFETFALARLAQLAYEIYDANHDSLLSRDELIPALRFMGFKQGGDMDKFSHAFMEDIGLDQPKPGFGTKVRYVFSRLGAKKQNLNPGELFLRLKKVSKRFQGRKTDL